MEAAPPRPTLSPALIAAGLAFFLAAPCRTEEPPQLTLLRSSWAQAKTRSAQSSDQDYQRRLERLQNDLTDSGKIEEAITVKKEIQRLVADPNLCAETDLDATPKGSDQLLPLRNTWLEMRAKAAKPTVVIYLRELEKLQGQLAKAGELEGALAVKQEVERVKSGAPADVTDHESPKFVGKRWKTSSGSQFLFKNDGTGTQANAAGREWPTKWKEGSDGLIVVDGWQDDVEAKLYFRFEKAKEGIFGANPDRLDKNVSVVE